MRGEPPLDPTSAQAREWLEAELRKGVYQENPGLLQRLWDWVTRTLLESTAVGGGLPAWTIWLAVLVGAAVVATVIARSVRAERRMTGAGRGGPLDGPARSAAEHRAAAAAALEANDPDTAVLEAYRAVARSAVERTLLDDLPGRTAHEVSVVLAEAFPAQAEGLARAADAFDAVRYGRRPSSDGTARAVLALDADLARTRPVLRDPLGEPGGGPMTAAVDDRPQGRDVGPPRHRGGRGAGRGRRVGAYVAAVSLGLLLVVLLALTGQRPTQPLDPQGPGPEGAQALAEVLRDQGVAVEVVRSISALEAAAPDRSTTVLVGDTTTLGPGAAARLGAASRDVPRLVVVGGVTEQLDAIGVPASAYPGGVDGLPARCDSPIARDDDVVSTSDTRYLPDAGSPASSCFVLPEGDEGDGGEDPAGPGGGSGAAMLELPAGVSHPATVLVGFGRAWTNEEITAESNAGLAVRALGSTPRLVWYMPGQGDLTAGGPGEDDGSSGIWPVWTTPVLALLAVVLVLLALWRGRRLGRLVREPLPVVVRAVETTESRGRLYRRAGDRGRAAAVLRAGTRDRLSRRLAVPPSAGGAALVHAVASSTHRPAGEVGGILFGPDPHDDTALIQLAQQLTDLEERAHHP